MPKPHRKGQSQGQPGPSSEGVDRAVAELEELAHNDRGTRRDAALSKEDMEEAAIPAQREVYERVTGKRVQSKRKDLSQRDVRARLEEDDEEEETEHTDPEALDIEERGAEDDDEDDGEPRVSKSDLNKATQALRRAHAPSWVFDEDPERILELAGSFAGYQSNADRVLQSKDETIRALTAAVAGKGKRAGVDDEIPGPEQPPEEDLVRATEGLARSIGVEGDEGTKKALLEFGRAVRKAGANPSAAERGEVERLQATVRDLIFEQGLRGLRRAYPELRSDADAVKRLKKRVVILSQDDSFSDDVPGLFKEAARGLFGDPRRTDNGRAPARRSSAPVTASRHERRESAALQQGTEAHDRAVYARTMKQSRSRLAARR